MKQLFLSCLILFFGYDNFVIAQNSKPPSGQSKKQSLQLSRMINQVRFLFFEKTENRLF